MLKGIIQLGQNSLLQLDGTRTSTSNWEHQYIFLRTFAFDLLYFTVQRSGSLGKVQRQQRSFWTQHSYYSTPKIAPILKGGEKMFKKPLLLRRISN
jgi:hypothetical protein